jgi:ABC-2 type transport system permease protein
MTDQVRTSEPLMAPQSGPSGTKRSFPAQGVPVIGRINHLGLWTLYMKEVRRFFKVQTQTIWAPAITTMLFLVIFSVAMGRGDRIVLGVNFATIVDFLMPPLSEAELMLAMVSAAMTRAVMVGLALGLAMLLWPSVHLTLAHPWAVVWFGLMGSLFLALLGFLSSLWAEKFDHNAAVTNFVIAPLSLLSGTFYVIDNLAPAFQTISRLNPFFYVISGFRFGFLGQSDIGSTNLAVLHSAIGLGVLNAVLAWVTYAVLRSGWRIKS